MSKARLLVLVAAVMFLAGCATTPVALYDGPPKPDAELAHVICKFSWFRTSSPFGPSALVKVDGKYGSSRCGNTFEFQHNNPGDGRCDLLVLPGRHSLEFQAPIPPVRVTFLAEKGKRYTVFEENSAITLRDETGRTVDVTCEPVPLYREPPPGDAATLEFDPGSFVGNLLPFGPKWKLTMYRIDGQAADNAKTWYRFKSPVRLRPGEHTLEYMVSGAGARSLEVAHTKLTVAPGKTYKAQMTKVKTKLKTPWFDYLVEVQFKED